LVGVAWALGRAAAHRRSVGQPEVAGSALYTFEWDAEKARTNLRKHRVSFDEAATAFADPLSLTIPDPDHSLGEERFVLVGLSNRGRIVVVAHVERDGRIRLISARLASKRERHRYEEG